MILSISFFSSLPLFCSTEQTNLNVFEERRGSEVRERDEEEEEEEEEVERKKLLACVVVTYKKK